ncbi:MAG TPA: hypothetical protein VE032_02685 [Actinomycetota bacterium]|nr:hypothetical protein [Actinomycetota bacterium]
MDVAAFGVPVTTPPSPHGLDPWPLIGALATLLICTRVLGLPVRPVVVGFAIVLGPVVATTVDAWGVEATVALATVVTGTALGILRRGRAEEPPPSV